MKILMGAQSCGFGPIAKLAALAQLIPQHHRVFLGDTVAALYARRNAEAFDELHEVVSQDDRLSTELIKDSDWVVSAMDANLTMRAFAAGRPVVMVDSLFSFWQHERTLDELAELCRTAPRGPVEKVFDHFAELRPHERILAAHMLSEHSIVQSFRGVPERIAHFERLGVGRLHLTGSIIDLQGLSRSTARMEPECDLLINIGGFQNFLLDFDVNNAYLKLLHRWIPDLLADWTRFRNVTVCGGAFGDGRERQIRVGNRRASMRMLSHRRFLEVMASTPHYMLTPGLTAIHEAVALQQFPMALPEQHFGHVFNLESLHGTLFHRTGSRLSTVLPEHPVPPDDFTGTVAIARIAERIHSEDGLYQRFRTMMNDWIDTFVALSAHQRADGVAELRGHLDGRPIGDVVDSLLKLATTDRLAGSAGQPR